MAPCRCSFIIGFGTCSEEVVTTIVSLAVAGAAVAAEQKGMSGMEGQKGMSGMSGQKGMSGME